jgi:hypothetical protein
MKISIKKEEMLKFKCKSWIRIEVKPGSGSSYLKPELYSYHMGIISCLTQVTQPRISGLCRKKCIATRVLN